MTASNDRREPKTFRVTFTETTVYGIEIEAADSEQARLEAGRMRRRYGCDPQAGFVLVRDDLSTLVEEVTAEVDVQPPLA